MQLLATEATRTRTGELFAWEPMGSVPVKGKTELVTVLAPRAR